MFTRCPECETVFQIEIEDLKAAEGKVCCGECDSVFNALESLTDTPGGAEPEIIPEETGAAGADTASGESEAGKPVVGDLFDQPSETAGGEAPWTPDDEPDTAESRTPEESQWEQKLAELGLGHEGGAATETEVPEASVAEEVTAGVADAAIDEPAGMDAEWMHTPVVRRRSWPWALAALLAGLALIAQALHYWREDLARAQIFQPWLGQFYEAVGKPLPRQWDVRGYLVEKGAVSDHPEIAGTLLVNALIGNATEDRLPYPLLKVTLLDRWGEAIGERFFAPGEYLQRPVAAEALLKGGERAEASVLIVDPGQGAVSYGIDVCLRGPDNRLACAHQDGF